MIRRRRWLPIASLWPSFDSMLTPLDLLGLQKAGPGGTDLEASTTA